MLAGIITDLTNWLDDVSGNWWFLALIFAIALFDSVIPVVPSETCVIIGGVAAARGDYPLPAVIAAGAIGAFIGDNTAYLIGARFGPWIERRSAGRLKSRQRLDWARDQIHQRGGLLLITARFIPGGRTALTVSSGLTKQPRLWFVGWISAAVLIWATYAGLLGYIGGKSFKDNHTAAFLFAFGGALSVTIIIEVVRHVRNSRKKQRRRS